MEEGMERVREEREGGRDGESERGAHNEPLTAWRWGSLVRHDQAMT